MTKRFAQRGEGKAGCIFWLVVLITFIYIGWQVVPVKVNTSDLDEFITRQAETAGNASADQIQEAILARSRDLGLPVTPDKLEVTKGAGRIVIVCRYEIPINLLIYTYDWKIEHKVDRPVFLV